MALLLDMQTQTQQQRVVYANLPILAADKAAFSMVFKLKVSNISTTLQVLRSNGGCFFVSRTAGTPAGYVRFRFTFASAGNVDINVPITANQDEVYSWTFQRSAVDGERLKIYRNGTKILTNNTDADLLGDTGTGAIFVLGSSLLSDSTADIRFSEVGLTTQVLDQDDVTAIQSLPLTAVPGIEWGQTSTTTGGVCWQFSENISGNATAGNASLTSVYGGLSFTVPTGTPKWDATWNSYDTLGAPITEPITALTKSAGDLEFLRTYKAGNCISLLCGDSFAITSNNARMMWGKVRGFKFGDGTIDRVFTGGNASTAPLQWNGLEGTFGGSTARDAGLNVVDELYNETAFYQSVPLIINQYRLGTGYTPGTNNRLQRLVWDASAFAPSIVAPPDVGVNWKAIPIIHYRDDDAAFGEYVNDIDVGAFNQSFASFTSGNNGFVKLDLGARFPASAPSGVEVKTTADAETGSDKFFLIAGGMAERETIGTGVEFYCLGQESWALPGYANSLDRDPDGEKYMTLAGFDNFCESVVKPSTKPVYLELILGPETLTPSLCRNLIHMFKEKGISILGSRNLNYSGLILNNAWRSNGNDADCQALALGFLSYALRNSDTFCFNIYGILGGIQWDNSDTGGDQSAYAEARGWDAIPLQGGGTLDMSTYNALSDGVHPSDEESSFFFNYVMDQHAEELLRSGRRKAIAGPRRVLVY